MITTSGPRSIGYLPDASGTPAFAGTVATIDATSPGPGRLGEVSLPGTVNSEPPDPSEVLMFPTSVDSGHAPACAWPCGHFGTPDRLPAAPGGSDSFRPLSMSLASVRLIRM